jgi:hypothetical protein|tara:strand:+ start:1033 stop:1149 length:117 start_codon:yes stop_codon:yes gene_type:complete
MPTVHCAAVTAMPVAIGDENRHIVSTMAKWMDVSANGV